MLLVLVVLPGTVLPGASAFADPGAPRAIHLAGCITSQRPGDDPARLFADPARFDCRKPAHAWGAGNYWVRLTIPAAADVATAREGDQPPVFRFVPQWQRRLAVYTRDADGRIVSQWFDDTDLSRMTGIGEGVGISLSAHERPVTDVLIRIDAALNAYGLVSDPQLLDGDGLHGEELVATAVFAAFAGLGIGLFCYNIVLWLTIRERFQLTYCLSLLAMLAYVWASSGAMAVQFPGTPHTTRLATCYLMLAFVGALSLQFFTDFIETGKIPRRLRAIVRNAGLGSVVAALAVILASPEWRPLADRVYVTTFMLLPPLGAAMTVIAWRRGSTAIRVLAIAWLVPILVTMVRIASAFHIFDSDTVVRYSLIVAMTVEALLSSLAMSFRIKLITNERDQALADERAARELANIDSLTGLLNRRALLEQVVEWSSPELLRLLLVDIDRFKLINDGYGHLVGDEVLREVAEVLAMRADLRASVARIGGEEFALIGTAEELSEAVALGILADIRSRTMTGGVKLTVSIGMAEGMVRSEDEWRELYRRADAALYRAKSEGRNRVVDAGQSGLTQHDEGSLAVA